MIYVLYGSDSYSARGFLDGLRQAVGEPDLRDANITHVAGGDATPNMLLGLGGTVPFLAQRRMVVVEGLLAAVVGQGRGRGRGRAAGEPMARWRGFGESARALPPTTDLVFHDGDLRPGNPLLRELSGAGEVHVFPPLKTPELLEWVRMEAVRRGGTFTGGATRTLVDLVGPDLWTLSNEVEKLVLRAADRPVDATDVEEMVSLAREASVFAAVDAVLAADHRTALRLVHRLLEGETTVPNVLRMLARQVRLLIVAQELLRERTPQDEIGRELGIASAYPLRKTLEQARATSPTALRQVHASLLQTDLAIKTGALGDRLALDVLVAQACSHLAASRGRGRGP